MRDGEQNPIRDATSRDRLVNRVVVAMVDKRRYRGFVYNLNTEDDKFHLFDTEDPAESMAEVIDLTDCKAIYFVRSHTGNPNYEENKTDLPAARRFGRPFRVTFNDGEVIVGIVEVYHPQRRGFYLIPPDPKSNNFRIFVVARNAAEVLPLSPEGKGLGHGKWTSPDPMKYAPEKRVEIVLRLLKGAGLAAVAEEVFLPPRVIFLWKETFVAAGKAALTDEAIIEARIAEDPARAGEKVGRHTVDERLDMVLRLFGDADRSTVSQVFLVPFKVLAEWRERFLDGGKDALRIQHHEETRRPAEEVSIFYESLRDPEAPSETSEMDDFLDGLSRSVGE